MEAAARNAVAHHLAAADLNPTCLPPSAILLIRSLRDPLPGRLAVSRAAASVDQRWQQELRSSVACIARTAVRPAQGRIRGSPEAIVFADDAELLACILLDLADAGRQTPWWREAVARQIPQSAMLDLLGKHIELLPPIFRLLAGWDSIERIALTLEPQQALQLCERLAMGFDLHAVACALSQIHAPDGRRGDVPIEPQSEERADRAGAAPIVGPANLSGERENSTHSLLPALNPCRRWFATSNPRLTVEHQVLIAMALGMETSLAEMSSPGFAPSLTHWMLWSRSSDEAWSGPAANHHFHPELEDDTASSGVAADAQSFDEMPFANATDDRFGRGATPIRRRDRPLTAEAPLSAATRLDVHPQINNDYQTTWDVDGVTTHLGGVFFLINLLERLGLPDCFEADCRLASAVGAFGTLECVARALVPHAAARLRADPVWEVLAKLDRREPGSPPRSAGLCCDELRLPHAWFDDFDRIDAAALGRSLSPSAQCISAIAALRGFGWPQPLLTWLLFVTPFLEWRLHQAFGTTLDEAAPAGTPESGNSFLQLLARVYVSEAHIDVVTSVENVNLAVRMAGLDRSPGWVKSLQRVVLFHFE